ncbi:nucleotidyltransferase domain-containing protein [Clostridium cochlearium]|uniref:Nucleotidyltransferase domain-containing protein n=1 Tax=Clostridium cochlearium TaxID=1494 RepID=A0A1G9HIG0_CLOCO|nr:nucleotidyltransferase domain-containing protein [Clostridium cochlearium]MBE6064732.1 nucleotidyltransferase domain-containing protein [Clostridium cochlearium]MBU5268322.1 nucleotidyltransferase domain-containing protein [Clostridium cochlearium]MCG4572065.1 nucleotidyltransferase domain-containing protein [Clostridium cochlearium]MCR1970831.1 nucleotidyltransferase domain-containing protein [Clostridium cochlearium]MDU1442122.1 nucleotidyltransferase domain-containing protein [Clostridiu
MYRTIMQYQDVFNRLVNKLKSKDEILAVMVFGSIVTGDLWDESDIDLFVITNKNMNGIRNIYIEEDNISVHVKLMNKNTFVALVNKNIKGGYVHRIFTSCKLVFSKDRDITNLYDRGRYYPDIDRERWNMVYLSNSLKSIGVCKKYLVNDGVYTAYISVVKAIEEFSKLYVNLSGYMISKDAITMAVSLNKDFKQYVDDLFFNREEVHDSIKRIIDFMEENINKNIRKTTAILLEYMRKKDEFLSAEDIMHDPLFENFDISLEDILERLYENEIIKRETRDYKTEDGETLFKENVYYL